MKFLPITKDTLVLRTDFSDEVLWAKICEVILLPNEKFGFIPHVEFVSDKDFEGLSSDDFLKQVPPGFLQNFFFVVDKKTFQNPEFPILCIDLYEQPGQSMRVVPPSMWIIENNLSISNCDFSEFMSGLDKDGIFRKTV